MVILRATKRVLARLRPAAATVGSSDTALGDWYVNRLVVDRQPLLLLISSRSYLPILTPARDVASLPRHLPSLVAARLRRLDIDSSLIEAEVAAMQPVLVAPTADRSVVGILVDFAKMAPHHLEPGVWDQTTLPFVEARLAETPCHAARPFEDVIFPERKAPELLESTWRNSAKRSLHPRA
jgi:hypothetical protein